MATNMLTTFDNPYNPFEQFDEWLMYDKQNGYNCSEKVGRIANITEDMTQIEEENEINRAIDSIIAHDFTNVYARSTIDNPIPGLKV